MDDPGFVNLLTLASSLSVYYAESLEDVNEALEKHSYSGLLAMSPMSASGTAAQAIAAFREAHPGALTIYHGWDHRIEISGPKALEYEADALLVGGVNTNDFVQFILMLLDRKSTAALPRPSLENYEKLLKDLCPNSAFWDIAETLRVNQVAPNQYE